MMQSVVEDINARLADDPDSFWENKRKSLLPLPLPKHKRYYMQQDVAAGPSQVNASMADLPEFSSWAISQ